MHDTLPIIVFSLTVLLFGLVSKRLEHSILTGPMFAVVVGILVGPLGLGTIHLGIESEVVQTLGKITLIIILFTDAAGIEARMLFSERTTPIRLLFVGLPLTIVMGAAIAFFVFPELGLWPAFLLACLLAPTDAALGEATVSDKRIPLSTRQSLNAESGLNDGLVLPAVLFFLALSNLSTPETRGREVDLLEWGDFILHQLLLGPVVGCLIGIVFGKLLDWSSHLDWCTPTFQRLAAPALGLLAYAAAETVHGNGFIAAFMAGLVLWATHPDLKRRIGDFGQAEGQQLALLTFLIFGADMLPNALPYMDWRTLLYAVLSLTVIRMVPVAIALTGAAVDWRDRVFAGWFGPRGIASILFLLLVSEEMKFPGHDFIQATVILTVFLSIFLHGITAAPGASWYAWYKQGRRPTPVLPGLAEPSPDS